MFLSIATTHRPAADLGFLLMKHPDRLHEVELPFGKARVFYPQADEGRCEAALALDLDPVGLVRRAGGEGLADQYVNDRPYAASSFLSVALNKAFRTAMSGVSRERPELAATPMPLEIVVTPLPVRGQEELVAKLFEPLGWRVETARVVSDGKPSRYVTLTLRGTLRVADALSQLYVLIPALDRDKHYWVGDDEVEKLLVKADAWLSTHPEREEIARRYLKNKSSLVRAALARLAPEEAAAETGDRQTGAEESLEAPLRLNDLRIEAVARVIGVSTATSVVDLGCGEGKLLAKLLEHKRLARIVGLDANSRALERAAERLKLDRAGGPSRERLTLLHGALTYRDARWKEMDAATLIEVIEHLDPDRLPALDAVVFGAARPRLVVVTTPNAEHNALFANLAPGAFRHPDHRFEWTRAEFHAWAEEVERRYGYAARFEEIGESHPEFGAPTQMAVLTR